MCCVCVHLHRCLSQLCHSSEQHIAGVGLLHVCSVKLLLQQNSHTPPPSLPLLLPPFASNFFLSLLNLYASVYPSTCHPFPFPKLLSTRCISSVSHPLSYFLTLSHTHSSVFRLLPSLSFSLPPNQSHMLEREAERSEDGQDCVVCRECGTVLEPVVRIHAWKCGTCLCLFDCVHACSDM